VRNRRLFAARLRRATGGVLLGLGLLLALPSAGVMAGPNGIPRDKYEAYTDVLVHGDEAHRRGVFEKLLEVPRASQSDVYGGIVGPIFTRPALLDGLNDEQRRGVFKPIVMHLADDQPEDDKTPLLFGSEIVKVLAADPKLVEELRGNNGLKVDLDTGTRKGWQRILRTARALMKDHAQDPAVRRAAIRLSAQCDCAQMADTLASLWEVLEQDKDRLTAADAAAYVAAASEMLHYRFPDVSSLFEFLRGQAKEMGTPESRAKWSAADRERVRGDLLAAVIVWIRARGGEQESRARKTAIDYGRRLIACATKPEDVQIFFGPGGASPELQRAAMEQARKLKPQATQPWSDLLAAALDHSDDGAVLDAVLAILAETFTQQAKVTQVVAAAMARRLGHPRGGDSLDQREKLATNLGRIGRLGDVRDALSDRRFQAADDPQQAVWSRLIRAIGLVDDGLVAALRPYYVPSAPDQRPREWERKATAQALGQKGFYSDPRQRSQAVAFLRHILEGVACKAVQPKGNGSAGADAAVQVFAGKELESPQAQAALAKGRVVLSLDEDTPDPALDVREAAIRSLGYYDVPQAADILGRIAVQKTDAGATALTVLGRQLSGGSDAAAQALARFIASLPEAKRLQAALEGVIQADAAQLGARARTTLGAALMPAFRDEKLGADLHRLVAAAAVHLAYLPAFAEIAKAWAKLDAKDKTRPAWLDLLRGLAVAVAHRGAKDPAQDEALAQAIQGLADVPQHLPTALSLFDAMGADADRFALKRKRADLIYTLTTAAEGGTRDQRRQELDTCIRLYRELVGQAPPADKADLYTNIYLALRRRSGPDWLADGENEIVFLLQAVTAAADSRVARVARQALDEVVPTVQKATLDAGQKSTLDADVQRLQKIVG
jgi:hypothetical protein